MDTCNICFEDIVDDKFKTSCEHKFHNKCLTHWVLSHNTCPLCRKNLVDNCYTNHCYSEEEYDSDLTSDEEDENNRYTFDISDSIFDIQDDVLFFRIMDTIDNIQLQLYENTETNIIYDSWKKIENDLYGFNNIFRRKNVSIDMQFILDEKTNTVYINIYEIKLFTIDANRFPNWKFDKIHNILYSLTNNNMISCF